MKRFLALLLVVFAAVSLTSCLGSKKEYAHDGVFTAIETSINYDGAPQVSWVKVTIEKGKVVSYYIDERQSTTTDGVFAWNAKTKKELGDEYNMKPASPIGKEWHEQAAAIEAKWLADGVDSVTFKDDGYIKNMPAEATMVGTTYNRLAKAALANAKAGVVTAFEIGTNHDNTPQLSWVNVTVEKGKVVSYYIDERQSTKTDGVFAWNAKTKKELGDEYNMKPASPIGKEWHEQAAAIEAKWLADGVDSVTFKDDGYIKNMPAEATMVGTTYNRLAKAAKALVK